MRNPSKLSWRQRGVEALGVLRLTTAEHRGRVIALVAVSLLSGLLEAAILALIAQTAATMVEGGSRVAADSGPVQVSGTVGWMLAIAGTCALARTGLQVVIAYLPSRIAADIQERMRCGLFDEFTRTSWSVQAEERDGHLQEILTSQVVQASQGLVQAGLFVTSVCAFLALLVSALFLHVGVAVAVVAVALLLSFALRPLSHQGRRYARELSATSLAFAGGVSEAVRVAEETQVFAASGSQVDNVRRLVRADRDAFLRTRFIARLVLYMYQSLAIALIVGGLAGLYWFGTGRVAVLGAVVLVLVRSATYGQQAYSFYLALLQAAPFIDRLQAAEVRYREAVPPAGDRRLDQVRDISFDCVNFAYRRGTPALGDVSFDVTAGEAIGIVGPSGAGKSTLVQILLRLRAPSSGLYLVNGQPAPEVSLPDWRRLVTCVPQEPRLVHGTVADNIRFFRDIDDDAVEEAARFAHIHDDILGWPGGYAAVVGQRADAVSGGQRQRICLARALAGAPQVLVLDEPTSALDLRSESLIQESLGGLRGRVTLFVVSHRMSMLAVCDRVMVLGGGNVEAFAPAASLQQDNAFYRSAVALSGSAGM